MSKWPAIIMLFMYGMQVVVHVSNNGKKREDYNGPLSFVNACIGLGILYWGGFFVPLFQ